MIVFLGIFLLFYMYFIFSKPPIKDNPSIGETKIVEGVEYFNVGTLDDEDNWIKVGSVVVQYYVNVYETSEGMIVKIEEKMNENTYDYVECYDFVEAERRFDFMARIYAEKGVDCLRND